jgi:Zn finger protein HypA/HybF involved in hydrogenase expression
MSDLISRQDTLKFLCEKCTEGDERMECGAYRCIEYRFIENMPSADRPTGEWERIPYSFTNGFRCSCCGTKSREKHWNYCPNCGARMKGVDNGEMD